MFLTVLNTIFLNISKNPSHFELRIHSVQTGVITSFVIISNVFLKRANCSIMSCYDKLIYTTVMRHHSLPKLIIKEQDKIPKSRSVPMD